MENAANQSSESSKADPDRTNADRFDKSLQELRHLRSQLHFAADYCQRAFSGTEHRKRVIEDAKEYISRATVTVVDHLGNVSENLECLLGTTSRVSETEFRLQCLKQKLLSWRQYAEAAALANVRQSEAFRAHQKHYRPSMSPFEEQSGAPRESLHQFKLSKKEKVLCSREGNQIGILKSLDTHRVSGLPGCDGPSIFSKPRSSSFGSRPKEAHRIGFGEQTRKGSQEKHPLALTERARRLAPNSNFRAFLRRNKRAA